MDKENAEALAVDLVLGRSAVAVVRLVLGVDVGDSLGSKLNP